MRLKRNLLTADGGWRPPVPDPLTVLIITVGVCMVVLGTTGLVILFSA